MSPTREDKCPKCHKGHVRPVFTDEYDFVACTSCKFAIELKDWNILQTAMKAISQI